MAFEIENGVLNKYIPEAGETEVVIPEGVTSIGDSAFFGCIDLISITIPEGVTSIGDSAFFGCIDLTSVTIPEGVTSIGEEAFNWCSSLRSVTIPQGVTSIGERAFYGCENLTSMTIPEGVTSIGEEAFNWCSSLRSVTIPESVTSIGLAAFGSCGSKSMTMYDIAFTTMIRNDRDFFDAMEMMKTRDFSMKLNTDIKYAAAVGFWMKTGDEAAEAFIRKSISRIMPFLIQNGNVDAIRKLLESRKFVTKKNIDKFIALAIEHTQNGGSPEIQTMLMHHKSEVTGYKDPAREFKL